MANRNNSIDTGAVMAAYLASEYAAAVEANLTLQERAALEALRVSAAEVRSPLLFELANAGDNFVQPENSHVPAALISALLEAPTSPGRVVTATELCAQMGRRWVRGRRFLDFMRLVHVFVDRMPPSASEDIGRWLCNAARARAARRRVVRTAGLSVIAAGCAAVALGVWLLRRR
ncbi:hypothetical protein SePPVgORF113 [Seal parapoxvirus]|uniref:Uncharacterized protein n=1 Tax=Seal parapoxvirus TaxID=187984 RepID=A0A1Z3GCP4_9POXV|nr:hypothetical protein CGV03_gp113 [Seal parapoxvirus]ASC55525.1 hypothetical protein SePPVgORF113 [Seal parapoxvirus]